MKELLSKYKNIILLIVIAVIIFSAYSIFFGGGDETEPTLVSESVQTEGDDVPGKEFLAVLLELRSLKFDGSIFTDKVFTVLTDFSQNVPPQPVGRLNPFLPIGNDQLPPLPSSENEGGSPQAESGEGSPNSSEGESES